MDRATIDATTASRIKVVGFDVDGVLTDAGVYLGMSGDSPVELKRFDIQDNVGVRLLHDAGLQTVLASGRLSRATDLRGEDLDVSEVLQAPKGFKLEGLARLLDQRRVGWDEVAFLGDDLPDLAVLSRVGLPAAVGNAVPEVVRICQYQTQARGGHGAVREFAEALLRARGEWDAMVERYVSERSNSPDARAEVAHG